MLRWPAVRLARGPLWLAARPNALGAPRLGMIVGKHQLRRSVDRSRAKRVIRECFRQADLPAMDIVVRLIEPRAGITRGDVARLFSALAAVLARRAERRRGR